MFNSRYKLKYRDIISSPTSPTMSDTTPQSQQFGRLMSENAALRHHNQKLAKENEALQQSEAESEARLLEVLKAQLEVRTKELERTDFVSSAGSNTGQPHGDEGRNLQEARLDVNRKIQEAISKVCCDVQRLLDSNQKLKAQKSVLENKISRMQQEKPKITFEIDDLTIMSRWAQLDNDIVQISCKYLRADFEIESFCSGQQALHHSTCASSSPKDYVENRTLTPFFFRAVGDFRCLFLHDISVYSMLSQYLMGDGTTAYSRNFHYSLSRYHIHPKESKC